ncbi:MAG: SOS response-associated peptidase [Pelagimonas sp.]|jgi:putative SOS response-associated peptidase YedK|nr:SOS response-associated peptidase [Pelagimonas sp.]
MCGRIGLPGLSWEQFYAWQRGELDWDDVHRDPDAPLVRASWNIKPTQQIEIAYAQERNLTATTARWWFVPEWFKGPATQWKQTTFNARIETAHQKPTFRQAWRHQRCVIPVAGYYEWTGAKGQKQPWWITTQRNAPVMYLAGLYARRGDEGHSATILTRTALPQISHIHSRTPVILSQEQLWPWLGADIDDDEVIETLGTGFEGRMTYHKVAPFGRDDEGPELTEPLRSLL